MDTARKSIRTASIVVAIGSIGLPLAFTWLKFHDIPVASIVGGLDSRFIHRVAIVIYFFSWVAGCRHDLSLEKDLLHTSSASRKLPLAIVVAGGAIIILFAFMCLASDPTVFAIALVLFFSADFLGWRFVMRRHVKSAFRNARATAISQWERADRGGKERLTKLVVELAVAEELLVGNWIRTRYAAGFLLLTVMCLFEVHSFFVWWDHFFPLLPAALARSAVFLLFVLVVELMIWHKRVATRYVIGNVSWLIESFELAPKLPKKPNKAPEPTPGSVTPRATERDSK